jgi:cytochrome c
MRKTESRAPSTELKNQPAVKFYALSWCLGGSVLAAVLVAAIAPLSAQEPEASKTLMPGKGSELTMARCATCHDITHVTRARLSRGEWEFNVQNMIERGMTVQPHEIPIIVDYLAVYYNRDDAPPPPDPSAARFGMGPVSEDPVVRLLNANGCVACHQVEKRTVGPSFREVAAKFAGDHDATAKLAKKIRDGGAGNWGAVPMPPHPEIADSDLRQIVSWILQHR